MQRLLTGKVWFAGFEEAGAWENTTLGKYVRLQGGYAFKSNEFADQGIPIIRISNIINGIVDLADNIVYYNPFSISESFVVKQGDLLIAMSGATTGKVGRYRGENIAYLNQRVGKFVVRDAKTMDYKYLVQIVTTRKFRYALDQTLSVV